MFRKKVPPQPRVLYDRLPTYRSCDLDGMNEAMQRDGFVLIPGVLSSSEVETGRAMIDRLQPQDWDFQGRTDHYKSDSSGYQLPSRER